MLQQTEDSPRNRSISVDTCKLQVYVGLHLYFQEFWFSFFVYSMWTAWTKIFRGKPKCFANVLKNMVPDLNVLVRELKYLDRCTILCCIKNPVTHTHTLRVQTLLSHSVKSPKQTKTQTTQQGSHRQKSPRPEVIRSYSNEKTLHETVQSVLTLVNFKYMLVCICIFKISGLVFMSTLYGQLGPKFSEIGQNSLQMF